MKRLVLAMALICVLTASAVAGDIPTVDRTTPPSPTETSPIVEGTDPSDPSTADADALSTIETLMVMMAQWMAR